MKLRDRWDKCNVIDLPEETRAEVVKFVAKEREETERAKLSSRAYQVVRVLWVVVTVIAVVAIAVVANGYVESWREVRLRALPLPATCPPAPLCPPPALPSFDIRVVPTVGDAGK